MLNKNIILSKNFEEFSKTRIKECCLGGSYFTTTSDLDNILLRDLKADDDKSIGFCYDAYRNDNCFLFSDLAHYKIYSATPFILQQFLSVGKQYEMPPYVGKIEDFKDSEEKVELFLDTWRQAVEFGGMFVSRQTPLRNLFYIQSFIRLSYDKGDKEAEEFLNAIDIDQDYYLSFEEFADIDKAEEYMNLFKEIYKNYNYTYYDVATAYYKQFKFDLLYDEKKCLIYINKGLLNSSFEKISTEGFAVKHFITDKMFRGNDSLGIYTYYKMIDKDKRIILAERYNTFNDEAYCVIRSTFSLGKELITKDSFLKTKKKEKVNVAIYDREPIVQGEEASVVFDYLQVAYRYALEHV